jgi:hypothetical protein
MRSEVVGKEADRILRKNRYLSAVKKEAIPMERQFANRSSVANEGGREERFSIRLKTEQQQLSKSRFILEYDLTPINLPKERVSKEA